MRVLVVHNFYQHPGGEDHEVAAELQLLREAEHEVETFTLHNDDIARSSPIRVAGKTLWNGQVYRALRSLMRRYRPDVAHFHNTFPLVSPAGYYAAHAAAVPVVQSLHNYRLLCPNALLFRDGRVCEECVGRAVPWPGVAHRCYRASRAASAAVATMLAAHRALGSWRREVDLFVAPSRFTRQKFVDAGMAAERIVVKPNVVARDPGSGTGGGGYALYVGRLSVEKGVDTLLDAWRPERSPVMPLHIVGDGPLAGAVAAAADGRVVTWLGALPAADVERQMADAALLVVPSRCYETFGRVVIEAFAAGTPVVASSHGVLAELVEDGRTGALVPPGDAAALVDRVASLASRGATLVGMRAAARAAFEGQYDAAANRESLLDIYRLAGQRFAVARCA